MKTLLSSLLFFAALPALATSPCPTFQGTYVCVISETEKFTDTFATDRSGPVPLYTIPINDPVVPIHADGKLQAIVNDRGVEYSNRLLCRDGALDYTNRILKKFPDSYWSYRLSLDKEFIKVDYSKFQKNRLEFEGTYACVRQEQATPGKVAEAKKYLRYDSSGICHGYLEQIVDEYGHFIGLTAAKYSSGVVQPAHLRAMEASLDAIRTLDENGCQKTCEKRVDKEMCASWVQSAEEAFDKYLRTPQTDFVSRQCGPCQPYGSLGYSYLIKTYEGDPNLASDIETRYFKQDSFSGSIGEHQKMLKNYQRQCEVDRAQACRQP